MKGHLRIWQTANWDLVTTLEGLAPSVCVAISPDGKRIAQGGFEGVVVWDFPSGKKRHVFRGHSTSSLKFSPDGTLIASLFDGNFVMWDVDVWHATRLYRSQFGHVDELRTVIQR